MDSNGEYESEAKTMALRRARFSLRRPRSFVVEFSDSGPEGRPQARTTTSTHPPPKAQGPSQATSEGSGRFSQPTAESSHSVPAEVATAAAASGGDGVMPPLMASFPATASLPELVREFGQIRMKLRSPRHPSEPQHLQDQRKIFKELMQRDFSASFSLKALQDAERALIELYQAQQMTKVQYESFISFFKNLRALRDQHLKAERQANRVRCYKEKHTRTSITLQQLVEEGLAMKDRIIVVAAEIQKLEEQLYDLKAEQITLSSKLYKKIEEVNIICSYDDFMPYCKFLKEERFDTYQIPLHGFKMEQFKLFLNDNKGTIKIEGQRPKGGSRWSRFRQKFKLPCNVYNTKDIHASFGNGVLTIRLPKREPLMISNSDDNSDDKSELFVYNGKLVSLKISKRGILGSIALAAVGVAVGGYVILKHLPSTHVAEKH